MPIMSAADPDPAERAAAAAAYILPILDGFPYGIYIYKSIPPIGAVAYSFAPIVSAFQSLPFGGLILFFGLSAFTRNPGLSRFVRFNIQQALLLDIVLLIPGFVGNAGRMFGPDLAAVGTNFFFYLCVLVVGYSWSQIAIGRKPDQVPVLSDAANMQIGPM